MPYTNKNTMPLLMQEMDTSPIHLTEEQLGKYLDNRSSIEERQAVDAHIATCSRCRDDLQDLHSYSVRLPNELRELNLLAAAAAPSLALPSASRNRTLRLAGAVLAGAGLAAVLLWAIAIQPRLDRIARLEAENRKLVAGMSGNLSREEWERANAARKKVEQEKRALQARADQAARQQRMAENATHQQQAQNHSLETTVSGLRHQVAALERARSRPDITPWLSTSQRLANKAWTTGKMPIQVASALDSGSHAVSRGLFGPIRPVKTALVTDEPTLSWTPQSGADSYEIKVFQVEHGNAGREVVRKQVAGTESEWRVETPLKRGAFYEWHLVALLSDGERREAERNPASRFQIATRQVAQRYVQEQIRRAVQAAQDGLYADADTALREIIASRIDADTVAKAKQLLLSLQTQRQSSHSR